MFASTLLSLAGGTLLAGFAAGADKQAVVAPPPRLVPAVKTFPFEMRDEPWDDVLEWYADTTGLTPIYPIKPTGKFTFTPPKAKRFTVAEITDILNDEMGKQKLLLIRRQVSFTIIRTGEIDYGLVTRVTLDELPDRGRT